jgi:hypothetical protein
MLWVTVVNSVPFAGFQLLKVIVFELIDEVIYLTQQGKNSRGLSSVN